MPKIIISSVISKKNAAYGSIFFYQNYNFAYYSITDIFLKAEPEDDETLRK